MRRFYLREDTAVTTGVFDTLEEQRAVAEIFDVVEKSTVLDKFTPNPGLDGEPGGQEIFFETMAKEIILAGGNSSGKSWCGMIQSAFHILPEKDENGDKTGRTIHPNKTLRIPTTGIEGWMSSYSQDVQRDNLRSIFDKVFGPYVRERDIRDGIMHRAMFEGMDPRYPSWINCKWQTQGPKAYAGPKKHFIYLDEPHSRAIYRECQFRLTKGGVMWICMTPVVDADSPMLSRDVIWMRNDIIEPWERDPTMFPQRIVIYVDVEENYRHIDEEQVKAILAGLSPVERKIRKSGLFLVYTGKSCFNRQMLLETKDYLQENIQEASPKYGVLLEDLQEKPGHQVKFVEDEEIDYFPDKPDGEYAIRIWELPVPREGLQDNPGYVIAVDVAEGKPGGDYTCAYVFRRDTKAIVACLHGHLPEEQLAKELWLLGHYYNSGTPQFKPAWLAIEIRNQGNITQTYLIRGYAELGIKKYPIGRIFHRPTDTDLKKGMGYGTAPGWDTHVGTRSHVVAGARRAMVEAYREISNDRLCSIPDLACIDEGLGFVMDSNGKKYEGHPDDRIITLGIGHAVMELLPNPKRRAAPKEENPGDKDAWRIGTDANGNRVPMINHALIKKIIQEGPRIQPGMRF